MLQLMTLALLYSTCSANEERFKEKGIQYEEFGRARLMLDSESCRSRRLPMSTYINAMAEDEDSDVDGLILKTQLRNTFANVCRTFNLSSGTTLPSEAVLNFTAASGYLEQHRIRWSVQKFESELRSLFLFNKINPVFVQLIDQKWVNDVVDIATAAINFPMRCDTANLTVDILLCSDSEGTAQQGTLYAIAHSGQFMPENEAYVFYDVPEYVVQIDDQDEIVPVEFDSCKVVEVNVTGSTVKVASPIFTRHTSYELETEDGEPSLVAYTKIAPVENEVSFPGMAHAARDDVRSAKEAVRLYRVTRKGVPLLTNQPGKASVWDDVRDFFLHLV
ncbi:unnamed protein product [Heligmosomoides polygyrus]|uniref:ZP domain-containing protein n=1 Tax=Heligmosomoides polygyrus TaxID=6339 RepID=A0A183G777_HELPZ|nr:unnamed protein product [Heligmosomoides polygyrus]